MQLYRLQLKYFPDNFTHMAIDRLIAAENDDAAITEAADYIYSMVNVAVYNVYVKLETFDSEKRQIFGLMDVIGERK